MITAERILPIGIHLNGFKFLIPFFAIFRYEKKVDKFDVGERQGS